MPEVEAPDFSPGYPSQGEIIGPAWAGAWFVLGDLEWHLGSEVADIVVGESVPEVAMKTVQNLLYDAARRGLIEKQFRRDGVRRVWYRRIR